MSTPLPKHLEQMDKAQLENLCVNCGLCCYAAVPVAKGVNALVPELRCKFLTQKSNGAEGETCCSVYDQRFEKAGAWCLPLGDAIAKGILPHGCPYVKDMPSYSGKVALDERVYQIVRPQIKKALASAELPAWASPDAWKSFIDGDRK